MGRHCQQHVLAESYVSVSIPATLPRPRRAVLSRLTPKVFSEVGEGNGELGFCRRLQ